MVYLIGAGVAGFLLGVFGAHYKKLFILLLIAMPPIGIFVLKTLAPGAAAAGLSEGASISSISTVFNMLSETGRLGVLIFPSAVILGRLIGWMKIKSKKPKASEDSSVRKTRILKEYGYADGNF